MINRSCALFLALVFVSGPALANHRDHWDADPVNSSYGAVGQCGNRIRVTRGTVVGAYPGTVVYGGNSISFPVNSGSVQYYDARTGGRYVGPASYNVNIQQPYGGAYNAYNQINQAYGAYNNQIQYHQYSGNPYVGTNPWNGYTGNTVNGYTYTPQPYYNNGQVNGLQHHANCSCCASRRNNVTYRGGGATNWMWNRR